MLGKMLAERFNRTDETGKREWASVKEWMEATGCDNLSTETASRIFFRGGEPAIPTFITMAYYLNFSPTEIAAACKEAGDKVFWRLIAPDYVGNEDQDLFNLLMAIPASKKKLALDILKELKG